MCQTEKGKATENMPKQPISETLALGQDEAAKSYTPYIKYTKLEFKVHKFLFLLFVISLSLCCGGILVFASSTCDRISNSDGRRENC